MGQSITGVISRGLILNGLESLPASTEMLVVSSTGSVDSQAIPEATPSVDDYTAGANNAADYGKAGVIRENSDSHTCVAIGNEGEYVKAEIVNESSTTSISLDIVTA